MSGSVNKVILPDDEDAELIDWYLAGNSTTYVSKVLQIPQSTVRNRLKKHGILRSRADGVRLALSQRPSPLKGVVRPKFSDEWRSNISKAKLKWADDNAKGVSAKSNGYVEYTRGPHKGRYVHVVKMEERLGRNIFQDECVHHIDGDKYNNDMNNLALVTRSGHARLHRFEDILAAKNPFTKRSN